VLLLIAASKVGDSCFFGAATAAIKPTAPPALRLWRSPRWSRLFWAGGRLLVGALADGDTPTRYSHSKRN
jgi:hypothetical protein